jgi:hypothetical protein
MLTTSGILFPCDELTEEDEFEMSGFDDDELDEADAQACWALEVQSQVACMNHRQRF